MSKYRIEYELEARLCDAVMVEMLSACGFDEYPVTSTGAIKIRMESDEMPTKKQQDEFIRNTCRELTGKKTDEGMLILSVRFRRINEAYRCEEEKEGHAK